MMNLIDHGKSRRALRNSERIPDDTGREPFVKAVYSQWMKRLARVLDRLCSETASFQAVIRCCHAAGINCHDIAEARTLAQYVKRNFPGKRKDLRMRTQRWL